MSDGFVQVAPDSSGKRIHNAVVILPAGTVVTNADGTTTTLASDTPVFRQIVVIGDPSTLQQAKVGGESGKGYVLVDAAAFNELLEKMDEMIEIMKLGFDL